MTLQEVIDNYSVVKKHDFTVKCPICTQKQYSLYDKLFTESYAECPNCNSDTSEEYLRKGTEILRMIENEPEKEAG